MSSRKEDYLSDRIEANLIDVESVSPTGVQMSWSWHPWQNQTRVRLKCEELARRYSLGQHRCEACLELIQPHKRLDSRYCTEACRKKAARIRRAVRARGSGLRAYATL